MKRLLEINSVCGIRSTGRIVTSIAEEFEKNGYEVIVAYGRENVPPKYKNKSLRIGSNLSAIFNAFLCRLLDNDGFAAKRQTKKFIKWAEKFDPDILWIHNLHGYYINIPVLFKWIKSRPKMEVRWTLHDCWAFTGHCTHFSFVGCNKWQSACERCPSKRTYPTSLFFSNAAKNYKLKKQSFLGVQKMTIITPSHWLESLVKSSYLKPYQVVVKHNAIDLEIFKPTPSNFRKKFNLENKTIVLGVASSWGPKKGLQDFVKLSSLLDKRFVVVIVGLTNNQIKRMPSDIVCVPNTNSAKELAEIYTSADVFLHPRPR